ncbi:MAG: hypothetical protein AVDCRST_MAG89-1371, partial [uncultured Gemmatimonadetes bacterium]
GGRAQAAGDRRGDPLRHRHADGVQGGHRGKHPRGLGARRPEARARAAVPERRHGARAGRRGRRARAAGLRAAQGVRRTQGAGGGASPPAGCAPGRSRRRVVHPGA